MSELFLELFSEEIPANLQSSARKEILEKFKNYFIEEKINYKDQAISISTPNRLIVYFKNVDEEIFQKSEEIRGPKIDSPYKFIDGFIKSNKIEKKHIYKKNTKKGNFYFYKKPSKKIKTIDLLNYQIPLILGSIFWKKSMRWGESDLYWARPLKSILSVFNGKILKFKFHHLVCSNKTFIDKNFEDKIKSFNNFSSYSAFFKKEKIILDNEQRKNFIEKELIKNSKYKSVKIDIDKKLLNEVSNIVEKPKIISCFFDKKYLNVPREIIIITMKHHQKYFPSFDKKDQLTNNFFIVANSEDPKGLIKNGNERVVEARLSDAEFFWNKNKSQSLVKQVSKLKNITFFKGLGSYYEKTERIRQLGGIVSDELLISKEKIEVASSICKTDLLSDLVGEFPELQGILGGYFAESQGFEKDVCNAIKEHYLPHGLNSKIPRKPYSVALSFSDKLDTLVGFFVINLKPTSSKDPYALRRLANGLIKIILENKIKFKFQDLIKYSCQLYKNQNLNFEIKKVQLELIDFFNERFKNYMKENGIRQDIIESATMTYNLDSILKIYQKAKILNKFISQDIGSDVMFSYKRAYNILSSEIKNKEFEILGNTDPGLFRSDFEKNLYKKINDIRKDFTNINKEDDHENLLKNLASVKKEVTEFFNNVIVNDKDVVIKKNRLELLQMLCKTFDNYFNLSRVENLS